MNHSEDFMRDCFIVFDRVGDSKIDADQVGDLSRSMGLNPRNCDIVSVTRNFAGKRLSFEDFLPVYQALEKMESEKQFDAASFQDGFKVFDSEGNGSMSVAELKDILTRLGEKLSEEEANAVLGAVVDSDGKVSIDKLVKYATASV